MAIAFLLAHALRDWLDIDVDLYHMSSPLWRLDGCGLGNGCALCEDDEGKGDAVEKMKEMCKAVVSEDNNIKLKAAAPKREARIR